MNPEPNAATIGRLCRERLRRRRDGCAVQSGSGSLSRGELLRAGDSIGHRLGELGVGAGEPVVLALPNDLAFAPACLALLGEGATVVLLSPKAGADEIRFVLETTGARWCIAPDRFADRAADAFARRHALEAGASLLRTAIRGETPAAIRGAAVVKYTSGSTARPKGVMLPARQLIAEVEAVVEGLGLGPGDRVLATVPLTHSYGFDLGLLPMLFGHTTLVLQRSFVPPRTLRALTDGSVTVFLGVPGMYRFLVDAPARAPLSPRLRYLLSCTAPLPPSLIGRFRERFGRSIVQHYGSSETGAVAVHEEAEVAGRDGSVGRAMPGVRIRILDGRGEPLPAGMAGEVHVSGPAVSAGYAPGTGPVPGPFVDGGFRTGDVGWLDEDGFLFVTGRSDDVINVGGFKVFPGEVVGVLEGLDQVREARVTAGATARGESFVLASVIPRSPITEEEILAHCRRHLADYKVPHRVQIIERLPKTGGVGSAAGGMRS